MTASRRERKFLISTAERLVLRQRLGRVLRPDPHAPGGTYHVRSLYFDTVQDSALFEKLAGLHTRHRWRLRIYNRRPDRVRLERKQRVGNLVRKDATVISRILAADLIAGAPLRPLPDAPLVRAFVAEQRGHGLRPAVVVDYLREPFVHRAGNVRVTLDRNLRSGGHSMDLFDPRLQTVPVLDGTRRTILEVKSTGLLPVHVSQLLPGSISPAQALSKYILCRRPMRRSRWEDPDES